MNRQQAIDYIQNKIYEVLDEDEILALDEYINYYGEDKDNLDPVFLDQYIDDCIHYEEETDTYELNTPDHLVFVDPTLQGKFIKYSWAGSTIYKLA